MTMMKNINARCMLFSASALLFVGISISHLMAQKDVAGRYVGRDSRGTLQINEDRTFLYLNRDKGPQFYSLDTLAFGTWDREGDFVVLNTPRSLDHRNLKVVVEEKAIEGFDSLVIDKRVHMKKLCGSTAEREYLHIVFLSIAIVTSSARQFLLKQIGFLYTKMLLTEFITLTSLLE